MSYRVYQKTTVSGIAQGIDGKTYNLGNKAFSATCLAPGGKWYMAQAQAERAAAKLNATAAPGTVYFAHKHGTPLD